MPHLYCGITWLHHRDSKGPSANQRGFGGEPLPEPGLTRREMGAERPSKAKTGVRGVCVNCHRWSLHEADANFLEIVKGRDSACGALELLMVTLIWWDIPDIWEQGAW